MKNDRNEDENENEKNDGSEHENCGANDKNEKRNDPAIPLVSSAFNRGRSNSERC